MNTSGYKCITFLIDVQPSWLISNPPKFISSFLTACSLSILG